MTLARSERITSDCLSATVLEPPQAAGMAGLPTAGADLNELLANYERGLLGAALERTAGVKKRAAALLRISFRSFRYRLEKLGLDNAEDRDAG